MKADAQDVHYTHASAWEAYRQGFPEIAAALFRHVIERYPSSTEAADARYYLAHGHQFPADRAETHHARRPLLQPAVGAVATV